MPIPNKFLTNPAIQLTPNQIKLVHGISAKIKKQVAGCRGNPRSSLRDIGPQGIGGELATIILFSYGRRQILKRIREWSKLSVENGTNTGNDVPGHWFGLGKNIEVKTSTYGPGAQQGILYQRDNSSRQYTKNTAVACLLQIPLAHWYNPRILPDSFYIYLHVQQPFRYKFVCWATRMVFYRNWPYNKDIIKKLGPGYPVIGAHHSRCPGPRDFFDIIRWVDQ